MRAVRLVPICLPALLLMAVGVVSTQAGGADWQKSYPVSGKASVAVSTGDASTEVRSCGSCREVRIRVEWNDREPGDYFLNEFKSGDQVNFELKEKPHFGFHIGGGMRRGPHVTVETPSVADLNARTADGALKVSGIQGSLELHTSDGAVDVWDVAGTVRLTASDGAIRIHNASGTLESRSSDGSVAIDGRFTAVQVHTSDGSLDLTLAEGSKLTAASHIESSDGQVKVRLPRSLAADLDVHTSDGRIDCSLPVTTEGYNSSNSSGHSLRGRLNAGGAPLAIHTSDGNVTISAL